AYADGDHGSLPTGKARRRGRNRSAMKRILITITGSARLLAISAMVASAIAAAEVNRYYRVENIPAPPGIDSGCNGLSFLPDGRCVAAFDIGQVWIYTPKTGQWKMFAEGLHTPMGVLAISEREIVVAQRPELTRLVDTDGDGVA